tara:strand:+ start:136 stop:1659 length:1524 start_codon:yes stop_codon:yes gene_type:complete
MSKDLPKDYLTEKSITYIYINGSNQAWIKDYDVPTGEQIANSLNNAFIEMGHHTHGFVLASLSVPDKDSSQFKMVNELVKKYDIKYSNAFVITYMQSGNKIVDIAAMTVSTIGGSTNMEGMTMIKGGAVAKTCENLKKNAQKNKLEKGNLPPSKLQILKLNKKEIEILKVENKEIDISKNLMCTSGDQSMSLTDDFLKKKSVVFFKSEEGGVLLLKPGYTIPNMETMIDKMRVTFSEKGYCPSSYIDATDNLSKIANSYVLNQLTKQNAEFAIFYQIDYTKINMKVAQSHVMTIKSTKNIKEDKNESVFFTGPTYAKMMRQFNTTIKKQKIESGPCSSSSPKIIARNNFYQNHLETPLNLKQSTLLFIKPNNSDCSGKIDLRKETKNYKYYKDVAKKFNFNIKFIESKEELKIFANKDNTYIITPFIFHTSYKDVDTFGQFKDSNSSSSARRRKSQNFNNYNDGKVVLNFTNFYLKDIKTNDRYYVKHGKKIIEEEAFEKFLKTIGK